MPAPWNLDDLTPEEHAVLVGLLLTGRAMWREDRWEYLGVRRTLRVCSNDAAAGHWTYVCRSVAEVRAALRDDADAYDAARHDLIYERNACLTCSS